MKQIPVGILVLMSIVSCGQQEEQRKTEVKTEQSPTFPLKAFGHRPGNLSDRYLNCPVTYTLSDSFPILGKERKYKTATQINYKKDGWQNRAAADWTALNSFVPTGVTALIIDIRRDRDGNPLYYYFANDGLQNNVFEPWSASKFMAITAAASRSRQESQSSMGLNGKAGVYPIGDMVTAIHTYQGKGQAPGGGASGVFGSNSMAAYFLNVAGRRFSTALMKGSTHSKEGNLTAGWLRVNDSSRLEGGYGFAPWSKPGLYWYNSAGEQHRMGPVGGAVNGKNMSAIVMGEWIKRLALHEKEASTRMPGIQKADVQTLFYGNLNRKNEMGGMLAGQSTFLQSALLKKLVGQTSAAKFLAPHPQLDSKTGGKWRIYTKTGYGVSRSRKRGEVVTASYACLPKVEGGREFVIVTRASFPGRSLNQASLATQEAYNRLIPQVINFRADVFGKATAQKETCLKKANEQCGKLPKNMKCVFPKDSAIKYKNPVEVGNYVVATLAEDQDICNKDDFKPGTQLYFYKPYFHFSH